MDAFWIPRLAILALLHQTSMYEKSSIRGRPIMAAPANASDTKKVTNSLYGFECLCTKNIEYATMYYHNHKAIASLKSDECYLHPIKLKSDPNIYKISDMLCICPRTTEDDGTYCVYTTGEKRSTFKHQISRELAEPTVTCAVQNCSHEFCGCCRFRSTTRDTVSVECFQNISSSAQPRVESPVLMKELAQKELKRLNCTAPNPIRNENVTITPPGVLHSAITTHLPSPGAPSGSWISIIFVVVVLLLLIFLMVYCIYKAKRRRQRGSTGSQGDSHGAAGGPGDGQQDTVQEVCLMDEINPLVLSNTPETVDKA